MYNLALQGLEKGNRDPMVPLFFFGALLSAELACLIHGVFGLTVSVWFSVSR